MISPVEIFTYLWPRYSPSDIYHFSLAIRYVCSIVNLFNFWFLGYTDQPNTKFFLRLHCSCREVMERIRLPISRYRRSVASGEHAIGRYSLPRFRDIKTEKSCKLILNLHDFSDIFISLTMEAYKIAIIQLCPKVWPNTISDSSVTPFTVYMLIFIDSNSRMR